MKPGYEIIAHNVKLLRAIRKETQAEFGKRLGSDQKSIWAYEQGINKPKPEFLLAVSKLTGISVESLLNKKLRKDREGNIINIEHEGQLKNSRAELSEMIDDFEEQLLKLHKKLQSFREKIHEIDKQLKYSSNGKMSKN